ncbi:MAG: PucR family transcriptional regulator ligand-binding domain-containing protein, partial [Chloroflexota bacterium]|nr:PucR family transcriptional regulator ligand-binding domain-containing protein [Chloroflexota bacterium]
MSVEEAQNAALPAGTVLWGGRAGIHRGVSGTATLRARTPAFPALHGGEMALVPLPLLRQIEPRPRLDRLVTQLADAGVAAIVFLETTEGDRTSLEQAAATADQHTLPVLTVPPQHTAEMVETSLNHHLAGRRETLLRRSQELQQEFTTLAFAGRGLPAIVERLATITGLPAAWEDRSLELRGWARPAPATSVDLPADLPTLLRGARLPLLRWAKSVRPEASPDVAALPLRADSAGGAAPWTRLVVAFMAGGQVAGYISLVLPTGGADQEARLALSGAGLAASIEALRARAVTEAQGNATASLVRDWLAGRFDHPGELASRAVQLGHTPAPPYGVLVLETERVIPADGLQRLAHTMSSAPRESTPDQKGRRAEADVPLGGSVGGPGCLPLPPEDPLALSAVLDERRTVLLVPAVSMPAVDAAAAAIHALLVPLAAGGENAPPIFAGIGRPAARLEDVPRSYREAQQALAIARRLGGQHRVAYFGSLGVYRLLAAVSPTEELSSFYEDTLGPLVAHDQKSGGELLRTL